jgi:WD40 repeat protein
MKEDMQLETTSACPQCGSALTPSGNCGPCLFNVTFGSPDERQTAGAGSAPWTSFSGLDLFEEIGRGGMGVVYRARQAALDRDVAVKVLLRARFAGHEERTRFHREAKAAARLRHPGIVGILDVGETGGVPWFSMDYLPGSNLEELVRAHPMEQRQAAALVRSVAEALQHAHDHGVLHRDLKPSNILLDPDGQPRITDFGIARLATGGKRDVNFTISGQMLGSPGYAAPEQALSGKSDARTDVHGLGALLYHLLTGRPPFQGPTLDAVLVQLREDDPIPLRRLVPGTSVDIETICLKCLRKLPENRYAAARDVAGDLDRFLAGKPIHARPLGWPGKTWRWTRRHPALAGMFALTAVLLGGIVATAIGFARHQARMEQRTSLISEARSLRQTRHAESRTEALKKLVTAWRIKPSPEIRAEAAACLTLPEIGDWTHESRPAPDPGLSGDGTRIARFESPDIVVRETAGNREIFRLSGTAPGSVFKLDDHGERLAHHAPGSGDLVIVSLETSRVIATCKHPMHLHSLDWSGDLIATACDNRFIYIWDDEGELKHRLSGHESPFIRVAFRPRSQELASTSADNHIRLWHAARGAEILRREVHHQPHKRLWWSATGHMLHGLIDDGRCETFPVSPSPIVDVFAPPQDEPHSENLGTADLSPDGRLAVVVDENCARLWDLDKGRVIRLFPKPAGQWLSARFSPNGRLLWTCGWGHPLEEWRIESKNGNLMLNHARTLIDTQGNLIRANTADGNQLVLSNNSTGHFIVLDSMRKTMLRLHHPGTLATAISPDGRWLLTSSYQQPGVKVWSLWDGTHATNLLNGQSVVQIMALDERRFLLRTSASTHVFHSDTWKQEREFDQPYPVYSMTTAPDGRFLAVQGDSEVRILSTSDLTEIHRLAAPAHAGWLGDGHLVFNQDGSILLLHTSIGTLVRWDLSKLAVAMNRLGLDRNDASNR